MIKSDATIALISYYLRSRLYKNIYSDLSLNDGVHEESKIYLEFWKACSIGFDGNISKAISILEEIKNRRDFSSYPANVALLWFHRQTTEVEEEEIDRLELRMSSISNHTLTDESIILSSEFYHYAGGELEARRELKLMKSKYGENTTGNLDALILLAWMDLTDYKKNDDSIMKKVTIFPNTLFNLDCLMLLAKCSEIQGNYIDAINYLNKAFSMNDSFFPAFVEKAKLHLKMHDFDNALETSCSLLQSFESNIEVLRICSFVQLISQGCSDAFLETSDKIINHVSISESNDASMCHKTSSFYSRLCSHNADVVSRVINLISKSCQGENCSRCQIELGYNFRLSANFDKAFEVYYQSLKYDEINFEALYGILYCHVFKRQWMDVEQQIEFLSALEEGAERNPDMLLIRALMALNMRNDREEHLQFLRTSVENHLLNLQENQTFGKDIIDYYIKLNPDFLIVTANEFLKHRHFVEEIDLVHNEEQSSQDIHRNPTLEGLEILDLVLSKVPYNVEAFTIMTKLDLESGKISKALFRINSHLSNIPNSIEAHLLLAQLKTSQGEFDGAQQCLEEVLSIDFRARDCPLYRLIKSKCIVGKGDLYLITAKNLLEEAIAMPEVTQDLFSNGLITVRDRISITTLLASILTQLDFYPEAKEILIKAKTDFDGTVEQINILNFLSKLAVRKNDFTEAIQIMDSIPCDSPVYFSAQVAKANLFLDHHQDKEAFINCLQDLVHEKKTLNSYMILGDAYMKIQSPELALESYENAFFSNSKNEQLIERIGKALKTTHDYKKAIEYYEKVLKHTPESQIVYCELLQLYTAFKKYTKAIKLLMKFFSINDFSLQIGSSCTSLIGLLNILIDLINEFFEYGHIDQVRCVFEQAKISIIKSSPRKILSMVSLGLAQCAHIEKDYTTALMHYKDVLDFDAAHEKSTIALAKIYMAENNVEQALFYCDIFLRIGNDIDSEEVLLIKASLLVMQTKFEDALSCYNNILNSNPNNYVAMSKAILLLRRIGKTIDAKLYFKNADEKDSKSSSHAGFHYSKGLYLRYTNSLSKAIRHFNKARIDNNFWSEQALINMIEIYLGLDYKGMWRIKKCTDNNYIHTVDTLLMELAKTGKDHLRINVLESYYLMAEAVLEPNEEKEDDNDNMNRAVENLIEVLDTNSEYIPALLGLSIAFLLENSIEKSRIMLKKITKITYNQPEFDNEFECSCLMLANINVDRKRYDLAKDILFKKCFVEQQLHTTSDLIPNSGSGSSKAYEIMGLICEKEKLIKDAIFYYKRSWDIEKELLLHNNDDDGSSNTDSHVIVIIGFKLASCYMTCQKYIEAMEISDLISNKFPEYGHLKEEIVNRCIASIRP